MSQRKLFRKCVSAYQGICLIVLSKVSLTLELQHILPNHKGRREEEQLTQCWTCNSPHTEHLCEISSESGEMNQEILPSTV